MTLNTNQFKRNPQWKVFIAGLGLLVFATAIFSGCRAANPSATTTPSTIAPTTTTPSSSVPQDDLLTIQGLILTNGTILVTEAPPTMGLVGDLLVVHLKDSKTVYEPGALVEFTIKSAIAESYPPQAQGISSRLIAKTSPVLKIPTAMATRIKFHLNDNALLIDVRTPEEYKSGHIPESINISSDKVRTELPRQTTDLTKTLLVYCRTGSRSAQAAKELKELGYRIVLDLGSITDFKEELVK